MKPNGQRRVLCSGGRRNATDCVQKRLFRDCLNRRGENRQMDLLGKGIASKERRNQILSPSIEIEMGGKRKKNIGANKRATDARGLGSATCGARRLRGGSP